MSALQRLPFCPYSKAMLASSALFSHLSKWRTHLLPAVAIAAWTVLAISLALQWSLGMVPCPMCIVQRYCIMALAIFTTLALFHQRWSVFVAIAFACMGAFTAARQSFLQWNPPEFMSCGRDFYAMVEAFPLSKLIPSLFAGSGDCASSAENLFGVTLANASFIFFAASAIGLAIFLWQRQHAKNPSA